ncbi:MAG TPA: P-loop NTPase fold protein [Tissierellaceae bacterium]
MYKSKGVCALMWSDSISKIDMLAYEPYAELIYEISVSERLNPLTIGLFGRWGSGKSTLLKLIEDKIELNKEKGRKVVSIKVNAWMYEGYDDAKTALMEDILRTINDNIPIKDECKNRLIRLLQRVDWLRLGSVVAKKGIPFLISAVSGNPLPLINTFKELVEIDFQNPENIKKLQEKIFQINDFIKEGDEKDYIVENIRTFRKEFEKLIKQSEVDNLIIMIDDLDRCSPERIIETIEAVKLFLSVERTTFIIAIDDEVLRYSIKKKYPKIDDERIIDISEDYIEKIIQLPIELPELSEIDIKNYMLLLICEMFLKENTLLKVIDGLKNKDIFTKGEIVNPQDIEDLLNDDDNTVYKDCSTKEQFNHYLLLFNKIGDIVASSLKGNPRQTKRFLNTYFMRKRLAEIQKIDLNEQILAKLMVLEYVNKDLFRELYKWQFNNKGIASELKKIETYVLEGKIDDEFENKYKKWLEPKIKDWLLLEPCNLSEVDLRQYFYLAKESIKEQKLTALNIKAEARKKANEICAPGLEDSARTNLIEQLKEVSLDYRNDVFNAIRVKFSQNHNEIKKVLLDFIKVFPEYTDEAIEELKKLEKNEVDPGFLFKIKTYFESQQAEKFEQLVNFYIERRIVDSRILGTLDKMARN